MQQIRWWRGSAFYFRTKRGKKKKRKKKQFRKSLCPEKSIREALSRKTKGKRAPAPLKAVNHPDSSSGWLNSLLFG